MIKQLLVQFSLAGIVLLSQVAPAPAAPKEESTKRPRIGLVLEGGGAKGFAHVGVLKVLEEARVPVDFVAGTSMGSIVGAAYASGRSLAELEEVLATTNWDTLFDEAPVRQNIAYREKAGRGREIFGDSKIGILNGKVVVPVALVQGHNIEPFLQRLLGKVPSDTSFDLLPIPFRAVAADIETGGAVVLERGSLARAARASMSVPGFFAPVEIDGKLLVDGGITNNFPIDVAIDHGVDIIIGVQIPDRLRTREKLTDPLAISGQILDMLLERTTQKGISLMRPQDILIEPEIGSYGSTSFADAKEIMKLGEASARTHLPKLQHLALSEEAYAAYLGKRTGGSEYLPVVQFVEVKNVPEYRKKEILRSFDANIGKPLDRSSVEREIKEVHSTGHYKKVSYEIIERDKQHGIQIVAEEKEWLKNYARVGFALEDDLNGSNSFAFAASTRFSELNEAGAYADAQIEIGRSPRLSLEGYQPLGRTNFFVSPEIVYNRQKILLADDGDTVAEYARKELTLSPRIGYSFGRWGEVLTGWRWGRGETERVIGEPSLASTDYDIGEGLLEFNLDQLDNVDFPKSGFLMSAKGFATREGLGGDENFERGIVSGSLPVTVGAGTLLVSLEGGGITEGAPISRNYSLGGFFDVSGYAQGSIVANDFWAGRIIYYHRIAEGGSALFPFGGYLGASSEFVSLRSNIPEIEDNSELVAGSVFIGADTPLLPIYLAYGMSDTSERSLYLTIGRLAARRR